MDSLIFLLLRLAYFVFVGLPLGWVCILVAWFCMLTVIGIPLGLWIFSKIPMVMTLQMNIEDRYRLSIGENEVFRGAVVQFPLLLRLLYLFLFGWWFSLIWMNIAFLLAATFIGIPIGFWMFNRIPMVLFLTRS